MPAPIEVHCPECQATLKLKNRDAVGRRVPCPKCGQPFVIELPAEDELEVLDEFDEFDEAEDFGDLGEVSATASGPPPMAAKSSGKMVWIIVGSVLGVGILGTGGFFGARAMGWLGSSQPVAQATAPENSGPPPAAAPELQPASQQPQASGVAPTTADDNPNGEFDTHWLPPNAEVVAGINLGGMWDAPLSQQTLNHPTLGPELRQALVEMKKETILGPDEISKITLGVSGVAEVMKVFSSASNGQVDKEALEKATLEKLIPAVVVHLRKALTSDHLSAMGRKMKTSTVDGKTVWVLPQASNELRMLVYQADEKTVVFSVERFIKQLIANGDPYTPRPDLAFVDGDQDLVVAVTLPEALTIPLPPGFAAAPNVQLPVIQSLLGLNGKLKGLGFGMEMLKNGSLSMKLQGLSSDETGSKSGKLALEEALKYGQQLLVPLKQNTFLAEQLKPVDAGFNGSKVTQAGPEFGFQAAFQLPEDQNLLAGVLAPAIQQARDAARRTQCQNNLKQIGVGMFSHQVAQKSFPDVAITDKAGKPLLSWRVAILPYIGQVELYKKFKLDEPWDSPANKALIELIPPSYVCPSGKLAKGMTTYRLISSGKSAYKDGKRVSDSALSVMGGSVAVPLVVDAGDQHAVAWTSPDPFAPSGDFGGHHLDGVNMLFADGSVRLLAAGGNQALAAPDDPNDDGTKDLAKFQGAWTVTSATSNGNTASQFVNQVFTFRTTNLQQSGGELKEPLQSTFQIDFRATPRTFTWLQRVNNQQKQFLGLYKFRGQTLQLTVAGPEQPRPAQVNTASGNVLQLSLKRRDATTVAKSDSASPPKPAPKPKPAAKPVASPGDALTGQAKTLFETVNNRRLVSSYMNKSMSIQLNPDGTTLDGQENSGTYTIKNLELTWEHEGGIFSLQFVSAKPKVGDTCTYKVKKTADGLLTFGPVTLKILEILPATPKPKPTTVLDGTWKVVSATKSGKPANSLKGRILSFAEGTASLNVTKLDAITYRFTYEVDTEAKPTTFRVLNGGRLNLSGVYKVQGNRLQLCFVRGEKTQAPKDFTAKRIGHTLYELEPVKVP